MSWVLLDGKFMYTTGEFRTNREMAIKDGFFISDITSINSDLNTKTILNANRVNFWLSKRREIKYFGVIFNWDVNNKNARTLIIDGQVNSLLYSIGSNSDLKFGIPNSIECEKGDTIKLVLYQLADLSNLNQITLLIQE